MKLKRMLSSFLCAVMLVGTLTIPAFATSDFVYGSSSEYGMEYGESGGTVGVIRKTDKFGKTIYVHGSPLNNKVFALVNAPAMDYTKTIGSVTFSNYIKHNEKTLNAGFNNGVREKIKVTQVYVGIGASMRSNVDDVEFMMSYNNGAFNDFNSGLLQGYDVTSDLALVKTNTPAYSANNGTPYYEYIDYFSIRPYTNLGRNYDGTWQKGLTWVFEEHTEDYGGGSGWGYASDPNQYRKIYSIRVESPNGTEYYQVIVTAEKNFAGEKQEAPVEPPKVETPTVEMPTLKSFKDVPASRWSHDAIMEMVDLGMFAGTKAPDKNGVGEFNPTGTMTKAQFLVVATRYLFNDELNQMEQGETWYSNNYDVAVAEGMITEKEFSFTDLNTPITREEMALIAVRAVEAKGVTMPEKADKSDIADFNTISTYYQDFVRQAFSMGLISGYDSKGTFGPKDTLTREQGAMVAYRIVNAEDVANKPVTDKPTIDGDTVTLPDGTTIVVPGSNPSEDTSGVMTIYEGQITMRPAKAGDTYVKADGTKVVLKVGPNGILGEGQGVAPDKNLKTEASGWTGDRFNFIASKTGNLTDSLGNTLQNGRYIVNYTTGEGHWDTEWKVLMAKYPAPAKNGSYDGQISTDPYSLYYWDGICWSFNS